MGGDGNGAKGGSELGGRALNKGCGLDVGTPRCSSWVELLSVYPRMMSWQHPGVNRHSQYSPVFLPGASDTPYKLLTIPKMTSWVA